MNELAYKSTSTQSLEHLADETEETLRELKAELRHREERAQHTEIDLLEDHMANAELSLRVVKDFFKEVLEELRTNPKNNT